MFRSLITTEMPHLASLNEDESIPDVHKASRPQALLDIILKSDFQEMQRR